MPRATSTTSRTASRTIEALVLIRERTPISAALLARLPKLKLITISGPYPNVDLKACTRARRRAVRRRESPDARNA